MLPRTLNLLNLLDKKSHFLFGPRGTGKSTLIREQLGTSALTISLLNSNFYLRLSNRPSELEQIISGQERSVIVIDEVQKLPGLLDEVHRLMEEKRITFLLTGSSARKLKRGGANLLAGRAWNTSLFPLTSHEIPSFNLDRYLQFGGLPAVYLSQYPGEELQAYIQNYLVEEISAEGLVRELPLFSRFLQKAAYSSSEMLNYTEIASDLGVSPSTVREYYRILEDTLLGFTVEPLRKRNSRKEVSTSKFYLFDVGVANALRTAYDTTVDTQYRGSLFEHFIAQELRAALSYQKRSHPLCFWRTHTQHEVDFVIPQLLAVEVKSTHSSHRRMAKGLKHFSSEHSVKHRVLVSRDPVDRIEEEIRFLCYTTFLKELWSGSLLQ